MNNLKTGKHCANFDAILWIFWSLVPLNLFLLALIILFGWSCTILKWITVHNKFSKYKYLILNFRDCTFNYGVHIISVLCTSRWVLCHLSGNKFLLQIFVTNFFLEVYIRNVFVVEFQYFSLSRMDFFYLICRYNKFAKILGKNIENLKKFSNIFLENLYNFFKYFYVLYLYII